MRAMAVEQYVQNGTEFVSVNGCTLYQVDRERRELRRLTGKPVILTLEQRQVGRTADGEWEVLERYCSETGDSVVIDSSPGWLEDIGVTFGKRDPSEN